MSKKQPNSRLDTLFATLNQVDTALASENVLTPAGWTWECNSLGNYVSCSPEVNAALGISAEAFLNQPLQSFALVSKSMSIIEKALSQDVFPTEAEVFFQSGHGLLVSTRMSILLRTDENGNKNGWRGFNQVISTNPELLESFQTNPDLPAPFASPQYIESLHLADNFRKVKNAGDKQPQGFSVGQTSLSDQPGGKTGASDDLVVKFDLEESTGSIEIGKGNPQDYWDEDDRLLVQEVASQLSLALENARLYHSAQQQLTERITAEEETLRRNQDLSSLNQIGQKLNRLASPSEILDLISTAISQVIDNRNLFIALFDGDQQLISFPVYMVDGQPEILSGRPFGNGLIEYVIRSGVPLLLKKEIKNELKTRGIESYGQIAKSLLAVPMLAANKVVGVIAVQDFEHEGSFSEIHAELLSTIASQATIALENANLFQQMQGALVTIEVRERYQKNVARAVASLSELGTQSLADVLHILGEATQTSRVYFAQIIENGPNSYWQIISEWRDPEKPTWITNTRIFMKFPTGKYPFLANELKEQGKMSGITRIMPSPERDFLQSLNVLSFLAIAVPGKGKLPSFIGFDELGYERPWGTEEIETLQMAGAALSNTTIREDLVDQLQVSLDETENLYNASRRLALANNMQEMIAAITEGLRIPSVNRGEIILFIYGTYGNVESLQVAANWQSGWGTPPTPIGVIYPIGSLESFKELSSSTPSFFQDIHTDLTLNPFQTQIVDPDHTFSLAILPMWVGKRQIGVLLLHSDTKHHFADAEIRAYPSLIGQMAIAVENMRLFEQTQQTLGETELLYQASAELNIAKNYKDILNALLKFTFLEKPGGSTQDTSYVSLNYFENPPLGIEAPDKIQVAAQNKQLLLSYLSPQFFLRKMRLLPQLLRSGSPLFIDDLSQYPDIEEEARNLLANRLNVKSAMFMPLLVGGQWIGFILAIYQKPISFQETEIRQLSVLTGQAAVAFQNLRNVSLAERHAEEAMLLFQTSRRLIQAQSEAEFYQVTLDTCQRGIKTDSLAVYALDQGSNENQNNDACYKLALQRADKDGSTLNEDSRVPLDLFPYSNLLSFGESIICNNAAVDARLTEASRQWLAKVHITSALLIPIQVRNQKIGVLMAGRKEARNFTSSEMTFVQSVGSQLAVSLDNYHLLHEAQRRALELQTAAEIARDTSGTLALDTLLQRLVNLLLDRFNFYHAAIFLIDEQSGDAVVREATGEAGEKMKRDVYRVPVDANSIIGSVAQSAQSFLANNVNANPLYHPNSLLPGTQSELTTPLKIGQRVTGVLDVHSSYLNAFTSDDVTILQTLTDQIAVAIDTARSYEIAQKAIVEMREVDRLKSQFLANMSHELRTPLNSIIGFSRVIMKGIDGPITDTQQVDLNAIYNSGQHLLGLITDILDLSKIEAGKMELAFEDVVLSDLVNSVMSTASGLVKDKPIKLIRHIDPGLPLVQVDPMRLRQVLINFLSNAAKFTESGTITVEAFVQSGVDASNNEPARKAEVIVTVSDTGPGIALEDQKKLFQPFSQVDDSPTRKTGGTGLGLSISRSLIELHGGRIGLMHSEVGKGSTFFFTIPLRKTGRLKLSEELKPPENANNVILAIDDDQHVISLYERYLTPHGYRVIAHTDPGSAVEQVKKIKPFAITLDVMMPGKDGWQVLEDLKNDLQTRNIPVIMCSILEEEKKGFSLGASDYLIKPILQDDLITALNRLDTGKQVKEVLVVDDDPADLRLIQRMLETNGRFQVTLAQGGELAWNMIGNHLPQAVVLDLFMPGMDGFTFLEKLHSDPDLRNIPVIVLTGADLTPEQHQQLTDFGQQFFTKSMVNEKDLLDYLESALNKLKPQLSPQAN